MSDEVFDFLVAVEEWLAVRTTKREAVAAAGASGFEVVQAFAAQCTRTTRQVEATLLPAVAAFPTERSADAVNPEKPRPSLVYLLASRVCQQHDVRGTAEVAFRDGSPEGHLVTIPRVVFEAQLRDALTRALTESRYWGE